jgi:hypothetical protein
MRMRYVRPATTPRVSAALRFVQVGAQPLPQVNGSASAHAVYTAMVLPHPLVLLQVSMVRRPVSGATQRNQTSLYICGQAPG